MAETQGTTWQRCPVCNGAQTVPMGFYAGQAMATATDPQPCRTCKGMGIIADHNAASGVSVERDLLREAVEALEEIKLESPHSNPWIIIEHHEAIATEALASLKSGTA